MEPKPSSNVIDLSSRGVPAQPAALAELRLLSTRRLPALVAEVLDRADDALFDFVQRTKSSTEQQDYFDAMRELRRQRAQVEQRYRDRLAEVFSALEKRQPRSASLAQAPATSLDGLSLVGTDELEEQLACDQLIAQADRRHSEGLRQLERRLAVAAGLQEISADQNPIGAHHICQAFRSALAGVEASIKARLVLYKLFERELLDALGGLVHDANHRLHQLGIMPAMAPAKAPPRRVQESEPRGGSEERDGIRREVVRDRSDGSESGYAPRGDARRDRSYGSVSGSGAQHPAESVDQIFSSVRELCEAVLSAQRSTAAASEEAGGPARVYLPESHALSALQSLQKELPQALLNSIDDPQLSLSTLLKRELLSQAERLNLGDPGAELAAQDEQALFLVGMLFDVLLSQRSYERPVRRQFARLTVPYARAALLDQHLFALKTHPARQLLNSLAEACDGNRGESAAERDLLDRVGTVVDRLISEFNEDIAIFSELESDFRSFLDQHRKRAELAERRAAEAQRGKERLDEARAMAAMELASLMGAREAPPVVDQFLSRYWTHHLAVIFLREGGESARYADAKRSGEAVFQAFLACETGADLPPGLAEVATPILASSGITGPAAKEVVDAVEWVLHALRLGRVEAARKHPLPSALRDALEAEEKAAASEQSEATAETAATPVTDTTEVAAAKVDAAIAASSETAQPELHVVAEGPAEDEYDAADIEQIESLQVGAWVEFIGDDGNSIPTKLSWVSPISSRLLFVTRRGMRHCAASPQELAVMIKQGKLHLRVGDSAFEQAMNQVLGRLREAVPAQRVG
ncbi:DUF1631 family protein [Pseudomarimonas arenosa]|uniref:DUF1631 domain-containing protein n=1 Tax=Pseudomarimonas arenosa TaxID=2774145 RepID=A0AAW3ZN11_9GAMM|nr:DUF1631 family protein [Pseudomarimonas arenosa]MBD8526587.1 DUF1631 domain-containing protein [Pseudomarimonas arenosa]